MKQIPFFKPYLTGREGTYIQEALDCGHLSGDGFFSKKTCAHIQELIGEKCLLTPSGTHALELGMKVFDFEPGSEVILPSFTFSSTANAIIHAGLKPVFAEIRPDTLNIDETQIEKLITPKTRAILPVHYAGVGCEMNRIMELAKKYGLKVLEDAAQAVHSYYDGKPLGTIGDLGIFSFHRTKNITCGEGGAIIIKNQSYLRAIEIYREKGTNRADFLRKETNKYIWVDKGSSYLMGDLLAACLYAQLLEIEKITEARKNIFNYYRTQLEPLNGKHFRTPTIPENCRSNYHLFFLLLESKSRRDELIDFLRERGIEATFHFLPLHDSPAAKKYFMNQAPLPITTRTSETILRLPLYPDLTRGDQMRVIDAIHAYFA